MKNLFVLPTDKPSRLFVYDGKLGLAKGFQCGSDAIQNQKIYITNEEKTKYGDWCIDLDSYFVFEFATPYKHKRVKKIILTTDPKLIKDGVQAIEDEFLEWFVKNPSCEEVEVDWVDFSLSYFIKIPNKEALKGSMSEAIKQVVNNQLQEQPKQEPLEEVGMYQQELFNYLHDLGVTALQSEMQEIERIVLGMQQENSNINALHFEIDALKREIKVFKHQQEQDKNKYSEEEVIQFVDSVLFNKITRFLKNPKEVLQQFKKK